MSDYKKRFDSCSEYFMNHKISFFILKFIYKYLAIFVAVSYVVLLVFAFRGYFNNIPEPLLFKNSIIPFDTNSLLLTAKLILTPAASFILLSVIRQCINSKRPYEKYDIKPLFVRQAKGNSMPSRHVFSNTIIAMCFMYVSPLLGSFYILLSIIMAASRVLAGVHFIRDVLAGFVCGVVCGFIGLWLI